MRSLTGWRTCVALIRRRPIGWRPRQTMIRLLFVFDPWRSAILLTGGDKSGQWQTWYERAIPHAEELYAVYLKERAEEEASEQLH